MANNKQRYINTRLWNDNYVSVLDPIEKLLFIYCLTNEHTNISGIYEVPLKIVAIETGIDESMLKKIFPRLREKVRYINGVVVIKNFLRHQETDSFNVKKGILNCLKELDLNFLKTITKQGYYILPRYYSDTLCIPYIEGSNYSNLDSNSNLDSIGDKSQVKKTPYSKQGAEILKAFEVIDLKNKTYYENKTQRAACDFLIENYGFEQVLELIPKLLETNKKSVYQITNPWEMKEKITKVFNDVKRKQLETKNKGRGFA